ASVLITSTESCCCERGVMAFPTQENFDIRMSVKASLGSRKIRARRGPEPLKAGIYPGSGSGVCAYLIDF
ncbi:MAG TPA: hypothetical protein PLL24_01325, partial [Thiobacillaceae bacterium]|nr:hypothetical protein [Thiobacillaceae bacterium]